MHALDISDFGSLEVFYESIGFSAKDKERKLERRVAKGRAWSRFVNVPVIGSWVDGRAKELGIKRRQFPGITNFFYDERGISRSVFSGVVRTFEDELARARSSNDSSQRIELLQDTISQLRMIEQSELILAKVKRVRWKRNLRDEKVIDIELTVNRSFIGNGFVLHNSARRYERAREMELTYYFNRVGEHAARVFVNDTKVTGLIAGGPGPTKEDFLKGGYLHYQLQKNVLAVIDSSYAGREGVRELVEKAADTLQDVRLIEEKKLVQRFLTEVNKPGGLAIYGLPRVLDALQKAIADTILISDDIETTKITMKCKNCGTTKERVVQNQSKMQATQEMISTPCEKCRSTDYEIHEKDIVEVLEETAFQVGAKVEVNPSLAQYHLNKLRELGLLREEGGDYEVASEVKVDLMRDFLRVGTMIVPRFVFYAVFFTVFAVYFAIITYQIYVYVPVVLWFTGFLALAAIIFWYEAQRAWRSAPSP